MKKLLLVFAALLGLAAPTHAAGTLPVALAQQVDQNGRPLAGALLYFYVVGTVATPQIAYQDTALSQPLPWPVQADQNGRLPMFYLADGSVHVRLTDAGGGVQFDYPNMTVIGPSISGGGGGGSTVDPTTLFSTGDVKIRPGNEVLTGWVRMNGNTIGSAASGATERANADTQNLYVWLWTNCATPNTNLECAVTGGLGASALADFGANKPIATPDMRARTPFGRDCMGAACLGNTSDIGGNTDDATATAGGASILDLEIFTWYQRL